ncbi:MAG: nitroreductase/quinone reductase family protein [Anaerolineales bacterium]|nr:nitroreductase/quinone reductase family protein [Anaerolineales bacterium]
MNGNSFIAWILRSPFHGMLSGGMMLITVTGRKSGKEITTPISYYENEGYLWTVTSRDRKWWRNLQGGAEVTLRLRGKDVRAFAELALDEELVKTRMTDFLIHVPQAARSFGIRVENKIPNAADVARISKDRLFVRAKLI